jgi:hypothetical protein
MTMCLGILEPAGDRSMSQRINVHHHNAPPELSAVIEPLQTGHQPLFDWTPAR